MTRSQELFDKASKVIPGGVNSPVRAFKGVGGTPVFFKEGKGAYIIDEDGDKYVDYIGSWGPMILGHGHPAVLEAIHKQVDIGLSFGAPTAVEIEAAEKVCELVPSIEKVRMVSSGTEATMSAIRLARGYTKRDKLIKFEGCYHGHADSLLVKAGSGALTLGVPSSPGIPEDLAKHTVTLEYNNLKEVAETLTEIGDQVACIIIEPVAGNMNCIPPVEGFLEGLRELCDQHGVVLIFDEVMTGFRTALGCAQSVYNITPDLTTLGKVIGGGMPVGAFGGKAEIMDYIAPTGPVYQAGTLSGNPVAMTAGLAVLNEISQPDFFEILTKKTTQLVEGIQQRADSAGIPFTTSQVGAMFGLFFTDQEKVTSFDQATACDMARFQKFFHLMLEEGVYLAPSAYEAVFVSAAHDDEAIQKTLDAAEKAFAKL